MLFPDRATIKFFQPTRARFHVGEPAQPDKAIRIIQVAKLSDHGHAGRFLTFDELALEKGDQYFASAGHKSVLAEFYNGTTGSIAHWVLVKSISQLVSQVFPPSSENACSQCGAADAFHK